MCQNNRFCQCDGLWRVKVDAEGASVHVYPQRGGLSMRDWGGVFFGHRLEYPKTPKQLAKALRKCREFCDKQNLAEGDAKYLKMVADRILSELDHQV